MTGWSQDVCARQVLLSAFQTMDVEASCLSSQLRYSMLIAVAILHVRKWGERVPQFAHDLWVTRC